jgi:hypothetical protein
MSEADKQTAYALLAQEVRDKYIEVFTQDDLRSPSYIGSSLLSVCLIHYSGSVNADVISFCLFYIDDDVHWTFVISLNNTRTTSVTFRAGTACSSVAPEFAAIFDGVHVAYLYSFLCFFKCSRRPS